MALSSSLKKVTYRNNPRLRRPDVEIPMTDEQWEEYKKCATSCDYFLTNYYKIIHVDRGEITYEPFSFQSRMTNAFEANRFVICMLPRQMGKSVCVVGYLLWYITFAEHMPRVAILANDAGVSQTLLGLLKFAYERIPLWMQQGVVEWNKTSIELENGAKALSDATTGDSIRGKSCSVVYLDEFAHVDTNQAEEFFTSVFPTISSGKTTRVIITSTPKGMNSFYRMWKEAVAGTSDYVPIEVHWSERPDRDKNWEALMRRNFTAEQFAQEFECVAHETMITVRDKYTGSVVTLPIGEVYGNLRDLQACA